MMAEIDGVVLHEEIKSIEDAMANLNVARDEYDKLKIEGEKTECIDALVIIYKMSKDKKKYLSAFLGYIISVDDDINDAELALWSFIIKVCTLPKMNIRQAVDIYRRF